jgi:hypothetical protein
MATLTVDDWKTKRKAWTDARDKGPAKVKQGAVRGVSMGDSIDKVHKAGLKGYRPLLAATDALRKDVKTYQTKGGKSVAGVAGFLKKLSDDIDALEKAAKADVATLGKLNPYMVNFHQLAVPGAPLIAQWQNAGTLMQRDTTGKLTWTEAAAEVKLYAQVPKVIKLWQDAITYLDGITFRLTLPGKAGAYAYINGMAQEYKDHYKYVTVWKKKIESAEEHLDIDKMTSQNLLALTHNSGPKWRAAIQSLLG